MKELKNCFCYNLCGLIYLPVCFQIKLNSKGLIFSVGLLLGSVFLTVSMQHSDCTSYQKFNILYERTVSISFCSHSCHTIHLSLSLPVSIHLLICLSARLSVCPGHGGSPEQVDIGQAPRSDVSPPLLCLPVFLLPHRVQHLHLCQPANLPG